MCREKAYDGNVLEFAEYAGLDVYTPDPNQIFVDIDSIDSWNTFDRWLNEPLNAERFSIKYTTSKGGWLHCYVTHKGIDTLSPYQRIAFESILGSDPWRCMFAMDDIMSGNEEFASCFYEVPDGRFRDVPEDGQYILRIGGKLSFIAAQFVQTEQE
jgi:hypothetical protein